jgi:hypothetical protein
MIRNATWTTRVYDFPAYRPTGRQAVATWDNAGISFLGAKLAMGKLAVKT